MKQFMVTMMCLALAMTIGCASNKAMVQDNLNDMMTLGISLWVDVSGKCIPKIVKTEIIPDLEKILYDMNDNPNYALGDLLLSLKTKFSDKFNSFKLPSTLINAINILFDDINDIGSGADILKGQKRDMAIQYLTFLIEKLKLIPDNAYCK